MGQAGTKTLAIASLGFIAGVALSRSMATREELALHPYLGLAVYPGSRVIGQDTETEFESSASMHEIFVFIDEQLVARGWQQTRFDERDDEIEALYSLGDRNLTLELEHEGEDLYELEIEMDDGARTTQDVTLQHAPEATSES